MKYLRESEHIEGQAAGSASQPPNLNQLISLLQRSQVCLPKQYVNMSNALAVHRGKAGSSFRMMLAYM